MLGGYPRSSNYTEKVSRPPQHESVFYLYPEELAECGIVWLARLSLDIFLGLSALVRLMIYVMVSCVPNPL